MSSKLFLRTYTLIMLSGQSGLFPLLPWSRLPLSCGCHQCSWWSWSCHAWCCVANVAATWQLQLQNDHVFTGFYHFEPFMAVIDIDCWMAMAPSWNSERQSEKHFVPADVCIIRHVEESLCSVSPNTPSTFGAGWSWGFKSQSEQSQVFGN